ncbi:MAG: PadR family transcriptional regulator [Mycobacteriaceae bacterium]
MALEHALLVSLAERPSSGYELAQRFDRSIGYYWGATHQQIYRTLKRMHSAQWVTCTLITQEGRPDKKTYSITTSGNEELRRWISTPVAPATLRDELAVKIRSASFGNIVDIIQEVTHHRAEHAERLDIYRQFAKNDYPNPDKLTGAKFHQYLVLRGGILGEEFFIRWCDELLEGLSPD